MASGEMRCGSWGQAGGVSLACFLLLLSLMTAATGTAAASVEVSRTLDALARDIGAAQVHAAALRERVAMAVEPSEGAEIAGIADGGIGSSLSALRLVARAVDRRLERLRLRTADDFSPDRAEVMLVLRASLAEFRWTVETMAPGFDIATEGVPPPESKLGRLDASLHELDLAMAAMASFDWPE